MLDELSDEGYYFYLRDVLREIINKEDNMDFITSIIGMAELIKERELKITK